MIKGIYKKMFSERTRIQFHVNLRKLKSFFLAGDRYYCPCCERSSSVFLKKGNGIESRLNAVCPHCGSLERTRLLYLYLKDQTSIFNNDPKVLHFAPEDILKQKLLHNPNYVDVDINQNFATYVMDITNIAFPDHYFDYIICSHVLGHIPDEKKALSELYRVLKPQGSLFLLSLTNPSSQNTVEDNINIVTPLQKLKIYGESDLERLYGLDFEERIACPGVTVNRIDWREHFNENERSRMSLGDGKREIIYKVSKI